MTGTELLEQLLTLLEAQVEGVEFRRSWACGWGSRLVVKPVVSGAVVSRRRTGAYLETVVRLSVFGSDASQREETAAAVEEAVMAKCPGCGSLAREEEQVDGVTKLPCLNLTLSFAGDLQGLAVTLAGKARTASRAAVTVSLSGEELVAVGEEEPFAVENAQTQYQVELEGVDLTGLESAGVFTAQVGDRVYTGCRWKKLDLQEGTAVFLAAGCEEEDEE